MLKTKSSYSGNLGQHSILAIKGTFYEKSSPPPPPTSYSIFFLKVLFQNKFLSNFPRREQDSIVKRNIGLEYSPSTIRKILKQLFYKPTQNIQNKINKSSNITNIANIDHNITNYMSKVKINGNRIYKFAHTIFNNPQQILRTLRKI